MGTLWATASEPVSQGICFRSSGHPRVQFTQPFSLKNFIYYEIGHTEQVPTSLPIQKFQATGLSVHMCVLCP